MARTRTKGYRQEEAVAAAVPWSTAEAAAATAAEAEAAEERLEHYLYVS